MAKSHDLMARIIAERERQFNLPGREWDVRNAPADWTTIVGHYLFESIRRGSVKPSLAEFEDSMVKAAAVIVAALEHAQHMAQHGHFAETPRPSGA